PSRRTFGLGMADAYSIYLIGDSLTYQWAELILADGGRVHFARTSSGTDKPGAVFEHAATPTRYYKSKIAWHTTRPGWDLTFADGTIYQFTDFNAYRGPGNVLVGIKDRAGNQLTITRALVSGVTHPYLSLPDRITSPNGRVVEFTVDTTNTNDVVLQARDPYSGRSVTYTYDSS